MTSKRDLSATNENALLAGTVNVVFFARLDFASGIKRFHTEIGPKDATHPVFGTETYFGIGAFGGIEGDVIESTTAAPAALRLNLTGVDASLINDVLTEDYKNRDCELLLGLEDTAGNLLDDPVILFSGYMDKSDIALQDGYGALRLTCESRGTNLLRSPDWRFTDEDLQREYPGDLLGEYIFRMADLSLVWGDRNFVPPFRPSPPIFPPGTRLTPL